MYIPTIDIIVIGLSAMLGIIFAIYLEKKVWPSFNKKHNLGEYAKENQEENITETLEKQA